MSTAITFQPPELERFGLLKKAVSDGLAICFIVGSALREIKERKFFLIDNHKTFDAFCDAEWGWTRRYCNQLIIDASAINSLPESMRKLITSHAAAKELAKLPEILRPSVVEIAASVKNGKPITAGAIKKASPPPRKTPGTAVPGRKKASIPARKGPPQPARPAQKVGPLDSTGLPVPAECLELWERANSESGPGAIIMYVSAIRARLKRAQEEKDPLFVEVDFVDDLAKLNQVFTDLQTAKPYAICPTCQGKLPQGCLTCSGRGFVSQFYWEHKVPEETRKMREAK